MLVVLMAINWAISTYLSPERWVENLIIAASLVLYLLVLQFFRNPVVHTTINDSFVYAPADGKVVVIEETKETEYFDEIRKQAIAGWRNFEVITRGDTTQGIPLG